MKLNNNIEEQQISSAATHADITKVEQVGTGDNFGDQMEEDGTLA